jgi:hypothetical protein
LGRSQKIYGHFTVRFSRVFALIFLLGRIITGLSDFALWKLGSVGRNITNRLNSMTSGGGDHDREFPFAKLGPFINNRNIKEEALERAPNITMNRMLNFDQT